MQTAKIFMNGRSQAVRLPAEFRFEGDEVAIRRDPVTGDVILSPCNRKFEEWLKLRDKLIAVIKKTATGDMVAVVSDGVTRGKAASDIVAAFYTP